MGDLRVRSRLVLSTDDMCQIPPMWTVVTNEKCGRAVVATLERLVCGKVATEAVLVPCIYLWLWCGSSLAVNGELTMWGCDTSPNLAPAIQVVQLYTWLEMSITWGPLFPVLLPLVLLALATNLLTFQ